MGSGVPGVEPEEIARAEVFTALRADTSVASRAIAL
jgi:hypothetical protein